MQEQYQGRARMDVATLNKQPAKPAREIVARANGPDQAIFVAIVRTPEGGTKETGLCIEGLNPDGEGARRMAQALAKGLAAYTGEAWAYPGCNDARGGL